VNTGVGKYGVGEYWLLGVNIIHNTFISKHVVEKYRDSALNLSVPLLTAKLPAYLI